MRVGSSAPLFTRSWAMTTRPLWPVNPALSPAACVVALTLSPICLVESPKTGVLRSSNSSAGSHRPETAD